MSTPPGGSRAVTIRPDGIDIVVGEQETIVDALRRQGLRTRYKCRRGGCGACRAILVDGEVTYPRAVSTTVLDGPRPEPGVRTCLPCRATPATDVVIELGPRDRIINVFNGFYASSPNPDNPPPTSSSATRKGQSCP